MESLFQSKRYREGLKRRGKTTEGKKEKLRKKNELQKKLQSKKETRGEWKKKQEENKGEKGVTIVIEGAHARTA